MNFQFYAPTKLLFGAGRLNDLHQQVLPGKKALVVTSGGQSVKKHGYLDRLYDQLQQSGCQYVLFNQISSNPNKSETVLGAAVARDEHCDFVVALGGGSVIDGAKAISLLATNPGDLWDYMHSGSGKGKAVSVPPLPLVAITTTAGTGSEANQIAVITDGTEKLGLSSPTLFPVLSIVDPELMTSVPPVFTAYQGMDALFHCVEGYLTKPATPVTDLFALDGVRKIKKSLVAAVKNGADIDARSDVALGNTFAGYVLAMGAMSTQHAMEHAMSAMHHDLPHGAGLIMISVAYFSAWAASDEGEVQRRMIELAKAMGVENPTSGADFVTALAALEKECGVDALRMSDYGITLDSLPALATLTRTNSPKSFANDRIILTDDDMLQIYQTSWR